MLFSNLAVMTLTQQRHLRPCLVLWLLSLTLPDFLVSAMPPPVDDLTVPAAVGVLKRPDPRTKFITPPAGRDALYRPGILQPWDFPPEIAEHADTEWDNVVNNPRHTSIMGPPGFWTESSLRQQYEATGHLRFAPELFPVPPPFEAWVKEQQMLRMIKMHEDTIKHQLLYRGDQWTTQDALAWELNRAEQLIIFRQLQISIALKYATLDPLVREYETKMYRFWAGFLQNFRYMNVAFFDHEGFIEQLEGSNKMLQTDLDQYLRRGGRRTDVAYKELLAVFYEGQGRLADLKRLLTSAGGLSDRDDYAEQAHRAIGLGHARSPSSPGPSTEHAWHGHSIATQAVDETVNDLERLKLSGKFRPPTL